MSPDHADVAIIGAGPSGLAAATELRRLGVGSVVVIDRESEAGGIPRHCFHQGFGVRDLRRVMSGPRYAASRAAAAERAGAQIMLGTQVTGWTPSGSMELTGPDGRRELSASAVVLATGCRERPRSARLIAGTRPQGVINTGTLQQLVHIEHEPVGSRAVVVGAEHVSFSALMTLRHAGVRAAAITTEHPRHQSFAALAVGARLPHRTRLLTRTRVSRVHGRGRVEGVEVTNLDSGVVERIACDLLVLTADWIPDHELAVLAGAVIDPGTRGPLVDDAGRTSRAGIFAAGNLLHGAEPADVAALSGRRVAGAVQEHLAGAAWPAGRVPVSCSRAAALGRAGPPPRRPRPAGRALPAAGDRGFAGRAAGNRAGRPRTGLAAAGQSPDRALDEARRLMVGAGRPVRRAGSDLGAIGAPAPLSESGRATGCWEARCRRCCSARRPRRG